ncbi:MAG: BolA family transcriptional regulator [Candidatus Pelagibacter sp.]|nr:BolA family transcriptional regulator [Candidatus Pelagibacter sp.]OUV96358.1 MAG: hypothetical protein CBD02_05070 [Candidatus Pelagibacter sp. TMED142]|tara:strand:+ start:68 stop:322 length:255 start_codon:yes stop_codon:yes gene_type:complete
MKLEDNIKLKLEKNFSISNIKVVNNSKYHSNHKDSPNNNNSHFLIKIQNRSLSKENKLLVHRQIYSILKDEMKIIHALEIQISE